MGVQTIQNGVDKFAWGIGQGIVRNCRETVCNFISRNVRNVDPGSAPKSTKIAPIRGVWHKAAANPNPAANPAAMNPNKRGVGAVAENAVPRGAAGQVSGGVMVNFLVLSMFNHVLRNGRQRACIPPSNSFWGALGLVHGMYRGL